LPKTVQGERALYLVLESLQDDKSVYREDRVYFLVLPANAALPASSPRFIGSDEKTQGDWRGKYGSVGHEVIGVATSLPADVSLDWSGANTYTWAASTDEPRALAENNSSRVAACRYAGEIELLVEVPAKGARLSLYCVDWDRTRAKQTFTVWGEDGSVLDQREAANLKRGCYVTWEMRGRLHITIEHEGGLNAVVSGLFLDAVE
jgi:hypothetical protein